MPAGSLYRAIQRTGGLKPIVDMVNDMVEKQRQRQALSDFMNYYSKFNQNIQDLNGTTTKTETAANPMYNPNSVLEDVGLNTNKSNPALDLSNMTGERKPSGMAALNPNLMAKEIVSAPTYQKQTETPIYSPEERYNKAQNAYSDLLASVIPNVDKLNPQVLSLVQSLAGNQVNRMRPEEINLTPVNKNTSGFVDKKGRFTRNPYYQEPTQKPKEQLLRERTRNGVKEYLYGYTDSNGKEIITKISPHNLPKGKSGDGSGGGSGDFAVEDYSNLTEGIRKLELLKGLRVNNMGEQLGTQKLSEKDLSEDEKLNLKNAGLENFKDLYRLGDGKIVTGKHLRSIVESERANYLKNANNLIIKEGLKKSVEHIRNGLKQTGGSLENVLKIYKQQNPNLSDLQWDALKAYFTLMRL